MRVDGNSTDDASNEPEQEMPAAPPLPRIRQVRQGRLCRTSMVPVATDLPPPRRSSDGGIGRWYHWLSCKPFGLARCRLSTGLAALEGVLEFNHTSCIPQKKSIDTPDRRGELKALGSAEHTALCNKIREKSKAILWRSASSLMYEHRRHPTSWSLAGIKS